jgi:hypothetical protein
MNSRKALGLLLTGTLLLIGCAVRKYHAEPISASASASNLRARSLRDPGLREFTEKNLGHAISTWLPRPGTSQRCLLLLCISIRI